MTDRQKLLDAQPEDEDGRTKLERFLAIPSAWFHYGSTDEEFERAMSGDYSPTAATRRAESRS